MRNNTYRTAEYLNGHLLTAIDIETTGRLPGFHEIIQIGVVPLDAEFQPITQQLPFYINMAPKHPERAEKNAQQVHGLNLKKLCEEAVSQEGGADLFCSWFDDLNLPLNKRLIPLAHNWAFEDGFLKHWLGLETKDIIWQGTARDSMSYASSVNDWHGTRGTKAPFQFVSLKHLRKVLKIKSHGKHHDALSDARDCAEIYQKLLQHYPCP